MSDAVLEMGAPLVDTPSRHLPDRTRSATKTRIQLDLPPRALDKLNEMREITEASSYAEVVKNALKIYAAIVEETEKGSEFMVKYKTGDMAVFRFFV